MNVETIAMIAMSMQNAQTETALIIVPAIMDTMAMALTAQVQVSFYLSIHFVLPKIFFDRYGMRMVCTTNFSFSF